MTIFDIKTIGPISFFLRGLFILSVSMQIPHEEPVALDPATAWLGPLVENVAVYMKMFMNENFVNGTNPPHLLELRIRCRTFLTHPREDTFGDIIKYAEENKMQDPPFGRIGGAFTGAEYYAKAISNWQKIKETYYMYFQ